MRAAPSVQRKIATRSISPSEIEEGFLNRQGPLLEDTRPLHITNPPTMWFLAKTNNGRLIKVVYILKGMQVVIKSAYEPDQPTVDYYCRNAPFPEADL